MFMFILYLIVVYFFSSLRSLMLYLSYMSPTRPVFQEANTAYHTGCRWGPYPRSLIRPISQSSNKVPSHSPPPPKRTVFQVGGLSCSLIMRHVIKSVGETHRTCHQQGLYPSPPMRPIIQSTNKAYLLGLWPIIEFVNKACHEVCQQSPFFP